jgi:hypothetical protein
LEGEVLKNLLKPVQGFALAVAVLLACANIALGQEATGNIVGTLSDPTGAPILDAQVTVENVATHISTKVLTDKEGYFRAPSLPIGIYTVTIVLAGFREQVFEKQSLQINQTLRLDAKLELGQQTEVVEVKDQAANIETANQTFGASVEGDTIQRAPLDGRNVLDLAGLQAGVTASSPDSGAAGSYSIAGGRPDSVTYLLDGGLNNNLLSNAVVFNPNPDVVAEFRVLESNYSAEYGRNAGGIVSVVTKSGTNNWHGSAFEFLRNAAFNANTFFNKINGLDRDELHRNQYGGTFGGPITIPKVVNGKDRFFFFVGYQGQRLSDQATTGNGTVFTPAQLNGDFSNGGQPGNCPNADTSVASFLTANPYFQSNPALQACGIIDPAKINPVAKNYIAAGLIASDPSGQASYQGAQTQNNNELTIKTDLMLTKQDTISVTLGGFRGPTLDPFNFATTPGFPDSGHTNNYFGNLAYTRTITPNLVNELRLYAQRNNHLQDQPAAKLPTAAELGVGTTPDNPTGPPNLYFNDSGMLVGFSENGPTSIIDNTYGFTDTVSLIHGRHSIKLGGGVSAYQNNTVYDYYINGEFDFYGSGGSGTGNEFADFILGIPSQYFQYPAAPSNIRSKSFFGFAQDQYRIARNLTLDFGIRYEYSTPKKDTEGRSFSIIPGLQSQRFVNAPVGLVFPGDPGAPNGANFPDRNDWAPRFGFDWDPKGDGKTSIRGGVGVFYDVLKGEDNLQFNGQPPFFSSVGLFFDNVTNQTSDVAYFSDPFGSAGVPNPFPSKPPSSDLDFGAAGFLPINSAGSVYFVEPHLRTPYTYQYNLSLQHEILPNTVFEVGYVGSSSHGLTGLQDVNPFVLGTTDRVLNLQQGNSSCLDTDGNSTSGVDPDATCSFGTAPEFRNVSKSSYNSMLTSITRQMSDTGWMGRTYFTFAYTFAHSIDNVSGFRERNSSVPSYATNLFRASSDADVRHTVVFSGGWDLPVDKWWGSGPKRLTQGWSVFPIFKWHTGFPYDVFAALSDRFDPAYEGPSGAGDPTNIHANIIGSTTSLNPKKAQDFGYGTGNYWINPNNFSNAQCGDDNNPIDSCVPGKTILPASSQVVANPSLASYGSLPRNYLRGPSFINLDFEVSKTTAISERLKLEFRSEFFNICNHANFSNPDTNINSDLFGQILSTYSPRIIQFALRLSF